MLHIRPYSFQRFWQRLTGSTNQWQPVWFFLVALGVGGLLTQLSASAAGLLLLRTAVLLLTLIEPLAGVVVAIIAGPLGAAESSVWLGGLLDSGQFFLLWSLIAWLAHGLRDRRLFLPRTFLTLPMSIFIFVAALSLVRAPSLRFGLKELVKWIEMLAIMLLVVDRAWRWRAKSHGQRLSAPILWLVTGLLLAGLSQAVLGIYQFGMRGDGPEHFLVLGRFYRAFGTFHQPNPFGGFMNFTAVLAFGIFLGCLPAVWLEVKKWRSGKASPSQATFRRQKLRILMAAGFVTAVALLAVVFSWSRGAWLALGAAVVGMILFWPKKIWLGGLLLLLGVSLLLLGFQVGLIPDSLTGRVSGFAEDLRFGDVRGEDINDDNYAVLERLAHWQAALGMAHDHPWLGVGFGNYEPAYADYALINWPFPLGHAHNYYLNLLAETGILGLAAYLLLWTAVFWQTIRLVRRLDGWQRGLALGLLGVWLSLTVHHLVDKLYVNNIYIQLGAMFGLLQLLDDRFSIIRG